MPTERNQLTRQAAAPDTITDPAADWVESNWTLKPGQWGFETDTGLVKLGDGVTPWNDLDYHGGGGGGVFRVLDPVKWFWIATGWEQTVNMVGADGSDPYLDGVMTATSNVAIPAPIDARSAMVSNGGSPARTAVWNASGEPPLGHPDNLADGVQVGDRVAYSDCWNYGNAGVYVVTDVGENGVRPWSMQRVDELPHSDRTVPWFVEMSGYGSGLGPTATLFPGCSPSFIVAAVTTGVASRALNFGSTASGTQSVASGPFSVASGSGASASGQSSVASGDQSVALGVTSVASGIGAVAVARQSIAATDNSVNTVFNTTT